MHDVGDAYIMLDKADNDKRRCLRRLRRLSSSSKAPSLFSNARVTRCSFVGLTIASIVTRPKMPRSGPIKMSRGNESAGRDQP